MKMRALSSKTTFLRVLWNFLRSQLILPTDLLKSSDKLYIIHYRHDKQCIKCVMNQQKNVTILTKRFRWSGTFSGVINAFI